MSDYQKEELSLTVKAVSALILSFFLSVFLSDVYIIMPKIAVLFTSLSFFFLSLVLFPKWVPFSLSFLGMNIVWLFVY